MIRIGKGGEGGILFVVITVVYPHSRIFFSIRKIGREGGGVRDTHGD